MKKKVGKRARERKNIDLLRVTTALEALSIDLRERTERAKGNKTPLCLMPGTRTLIIISLFPIGLLLALVASSSILLACVWFILLSPILLPILAYLEQSK